MKSGVTAAFVCAFILMLSACQKQEKEPWVPDATAIQVSEDGKITETIIDRLRESYYSSSELKEMVYSSVSDYQQANGTDSLSVTEFTAEGADIRIVLEYAGAKDYARFNNVRFYNGSMLGAQMEGFRFETTFQIVAKDGTVSAQRITPDGPVSHKEYQVLISDRLHEVEVPGNIVYVSAPSQVLDRRVVIPSAAEDSQETYPSGGEADLLYVLYEYQ